MWAVALTLVVGGIIIILWPLFGRDEKAAAASPTQQAEEVFTAVADVGRLYPAVPETIPVITAP